MDDMDDGDDRWNLEGNWLTDWRDGWIDVTYIWRLEARLEAVSNMERILSSFRISLFLTNQWIRSALLRLRRQICSIRSNGARGPQLKLDWVSQLTSDYGVECTKYNLVWHSLIVEEWLPLDVTAACFGTGVLALEQPSVEDYSDLVSLNSILHSE